MESTRGSGAAHAKQQVDLHRDGSPEVGPTGTPSRPRMPGFIRTCRVTWDNMACLGRLTSRGVEGWRTPPADPVAVLRTKKFLALLILAAVLGVVIAALIYWYLKLIADIQTWVFTDLPNGLGFHGEPPWWPLLPLGVAGVIVGATIRYLPGRGGH